MGQDDEIRHGEGDGIAYQELRFLGHGVLQTHRTQDGEEEGAHNGIREDAGSHICGPEERHIFQTVSTVPPGLCI